MIALTPTLTPWIRPDWIPKLETVDCPELDALRDEHQRLVEQYGDAAAHVSALLNRFEEEDRRSPGREVDDLLGGAMASEGSITPPERRLELTEAADARHDDAARALCGHVRQVVSSTLEHREEIEELVGIGTDPVPAPLESPYVDELERPAATGTQKEADRAAIVGWYRMKIQREGAQVLAQIGDLNPAQVAA